MHARGRRRRPVSGTGRTPSGKTCTSTARETRRACTPTRPPSSAARLEPCLHNATHTRPLPLFPFPFPTCHTHWRFPRSLSIFLSCFCWALRYFCPPGFSSVQPSECLFPVSARLCLPSTLTLGRVLLALGDARRRDETRCPYEHALLRWLRIS